MKMLLISLLSLFAANAFAASYYEDSARLDSCGGRVELRQAGNGDLALKFVGVNQRYCTGLRFVDVSNNRTIKSYDFQGTSYTLSKKMEKELSKDCAVKYQITNYNGRVVESGRVALTWWSCYISPKPNYGGGGYSSGGYRTYEWSNNGNCKIMINGVYSGNNTPQSQEYLCGQRPRRDVVTYEWSNKGNCKIMINGVYSGNNTPRSQEYLCRR